MLPETTQRVHGRRYSPAIPYNSNVLVLAPSREANDPARRLNRFFLEPRFRPTSGVGACEHQRVTSVTAAGNTV